MLPLKYEYVLSHSVAKGAHALASKLLIQNLQHSVWMRAITLGLRLAFAAVAFIIMVYFIKPGQWSAGMSVLIALVLYVVFSLLYQRQLFSGLADLTIKRKETISLSVTEDGLHTAVAQNRGYFPWAGVKEAMEHKGWLGIVVGELPTVLPVPDDAFENPQAREALINALQSNGVKYSNPLLKSSSGRVDTPADSSLVTTGLKGFVRDIRGMGRILVLRAPCPDMFIPSIPKIIVLPVLYTLIIFITQFIQAGDAEGGRFVTYSVNNLLSPFAGVALAAALAAWAGGRREQWGRLTLGFFFLLLVWPLADLFYDEGVRRVLVWAFGDIPLLRVPGYILFMLWLSFAAVVLAVRLTVTSSLRRPFAGLLTMIVMLTVFNMHRWLPTLWMVERDDSAWNVEVNEDVLYGQPRLLDAQLEGIQAGKPGVPELYFLGVGGAGYQDVFLNEVREVEKLFADHYGTTDRSLVLVNNPQTIETLPLANPESLSRALKRFGMQMNRDEDVLFLFLTSHGSRDHLFSFYFWPFSFTDLSPSMLRQALDDAGITRRVIVVSACYSGGFVPALQDEYTLVITAAAADRNSFGCSNENLFTDFGQAYFDEALRETRSFTKAFDLARARIATREEAKGLTPSYPQMEGGAALRPVLDTLYGDVNVSGKSGLN